MTILFYIAFVCLGCYIVMLTWLAIGFIRTKYFYAEGKLQSPVTIIICARNEEKTISICLRSIIKQDYEKNKIQLILINDASQDTTVQKAESVLKDSGINYKIISNAQQKGKKQSISYAMQFANHALIVMRDADTFTTSSLWLQTISDFQEKNSSDLIIAPVAITNNFGIFWALQAIENNILAVIAGGSAFYKRSFLCNGANLIFTKEIFEKVNGYASHEHIASGDDVLFMEDVKKIPGSRIDYLKSKDALVYTYPCASFSELMNQKVRWASKFKTNQNQLNFLLSVLSFAVNLIWFFLFIYVYLIHAHKTLCLTFIFSKLVFDILLLFLAARFIKNKSLMWFALPVGCVYPVYACMVGIASLFVKPKWKS